MRWRANAVGKCAGNQRRAAVSWRRLSAVGRLQAGGGCRLSGGGCRAAVMGRYPRGGKSGGKRGERQTTTQRGRSAHRRGRQESKASDAAHSRARKPEQGGGRSEDERSRPRLCAVGVPRGTLAMFHVKRLQCST